MLPTAIIEIIFEYIQYNINFTKLDISLPLYENNFYRFSSEKGNSVALNALAFNKFIPVKWLERYLVKQITPTSIPWVLLCSNTSIPVDFFERHITKLDSWSICTNTSIPMEFFRRHIDKIKECYWPALCSNSSVSYEFIEEHIDRLTKDCCLERSSSIFGECRLPSNASSKIFARRFFEKYIEEFDERAWCSLCSNPALDVEFFESHRHNINWYHLCSNPSIPFTFFEKNIHMIGNGEWNNLCDNPSIPWQLFECHLSKLSSKNLEILCTNKFLPFTFFERNLEKIKKINGKCFSFLCRNSAIPWKFFERHLDGFPHNIGDDHFISLCRNNFESHPRDRVLLWKFIEKSIKRVKRLEWFEICSNRSIPIDFILRHLDAINDLPLWAGWAPLCRNLGIPQYYISRLVREELLKIL